MDSTNVAVAEVNLVDDERAKERRLEGLSRLDSGDSGDAMITAVMTALQPQMQGLTSAVTHLDTRLQTVESNIATIMKQQEMIIQLLIQQSNAKLNDSVE